MPREVGIRQLKNGASALIKEVERGEIVTVTRRGRPVARLIPASLSQELARLIGEDRLRWSGRKPLLPQPVALKGDGKTAAEYVSEGRG